MSPEREVVRLFAEAQRALRARRRAAETETRRARTVEVECPECYGDGKGDLPADAPTMTTDLAGYPVPIDGLAP